MSRFPELDASLGEPLELPVPQPKGGVKIYAVPPCDAQTYLELTALFSENKDKAIEDDEGNPTPIDKTEMSLHRRCLGEDLVSALLADKVQMIYLRAAGFTALAWHLFGEERALQVWQRGGLPKAISTLKEENPETPVAVKSTPRRASASGTKMTKRRSPRASGGATS